jgi:single-strand DNA-binding protein
MGNTTRSPELKYTQSGMAVVELGLAVNEKRKNASGEWVDEAVFVDVTLWGKTAEIAGEHVQKGQQILIEGRLKLDTWNDRNTGEKRSKLRVTCDRLVFTGSKRDAGPQAEPGGYQPAAASSPAPAREPGYDDDVPRSASSSEPDDGLPF